MAPVPSCVPSQWLLSSPGVTCPSLEPHPTWCLLSLSQVLMSSSSYPIPVAAVLSQCPMAHLVSHPVTSCPLLAPPVPSPVSSQFLMSCPDAPRPILVPSVPSQWFLSHPDVLMAHPSTLCPLSVPYPIQMPHVPSCVPSQCLLSHLSTPCPILSPGALSWCLMSHGSDWCHILVAPVPSCVPS